MKNFDTEFFFGPWHAFIVKNFSQKKHIAILMDARFFKKPSILDQKKLLKAFDPNAQVEIFPCIAHEKYKTRNTKEKIEDQLLKKKFPKDGAILAIGGGIILDLAGFLAGTYFRGIDHFFLPTTLLAMVDASIGGKVAVNTSFGKNQIGVFHFPKAVGFDETFLKTLKRNELRQGFFEMAKHFLIHDRKTFLDISSLSLKQCILPKFIHKSIKIKQNIVTRDPFDLNERKMLNLGHTFAHAFETVSHAKIAHGDAVAMGICVEAFLSKERGLLPQEEFYLIEKIFNFVPKKPLPIKQIFEQIFWDKKNSEGQVFIIFLKYIGKIYRQKERVAHPMHSEEFKLLESYLIQRGFAC